MAEAVQHFLNIFELLPDEEKREVALEILKRTVHWDIPVLSEEELVLNAEELFLELDGSMRLKG